jgi:hypothetical protein
MKKLLAIALGVALAGLGTVALASRNPAGTMSVPALNPVTSGSTITIAWANGTISDISAELTDSLSRSGKGGMLAPIRTTDGTIAAPAHAFTSEPGLGFYRSAAGVGNFVSGGSNALIWSSTSVNTPLDMSFSKGSTQALTKSNVGNFQITNSVAGGNVVITAGTNAFINLASLVTPTITWVPITVGGASCSAGAVVPAYAKHMGAIYIRGLVVAATGGVRSCTLTALPAGARPAQGVQFKMTNAATHADMSAPYLLTDGTFTLATIDAGAGEITAELNALGASFIAEN